MTMLEDMCSHLKGQLPIKQLVGERVNVLYRNQGDPLPAMILRRVGGKHEYDLSGGAGFNNAAVEFESHAESYSAAVQLAETVREVLDTMRKRGDYAIGDGTLIMSILMASGEVDDFLPPADGSATGTFIVSQQFTVRHRESVPKHPL